MRSQCACSLNVSLHVSLHPSAIPVPPIKGWHIQLSCYCLSQPDWPLLVSLGRKVVQIYSLG